MIESIIKALEPSAVAVTDVEPHRSLRLRLFDAHPDDHPPALVLELSEEIPGRGLITTSKLVTLEAADHLGDAVVTMVLEDASRDLAAGIRTAERDNVSRHDG